MIDACTEGADLIGGCPYTDTDPVVHIDRIFAIARRFDLDIDFHLDFDLDPSWMHLHEVLRQTEAHRYGGRVAVGHVTKLSAIPLAEQIDMARRLADAGVAITVLPSTDLFLMGRAADHNAPRGVTRADRFHAHGVTCSLATNNVLNPFTPFGDASLIRMANLYANIAQLGRPQDLDDCLDMVTASAARLLNLRDYGVAVGKSAPISLSCRACAAATRSPRSPAPFSASSAGDAPSSMRPAASCRQRRNRKQRGQQPRGCWPRHFELIDPTMPPLRASRSPHRRTERQPGGPAGNRRCSSAGALR